MSKQVNRSLLSIGVISAAAFMGFGAIFHELDISIGTQAITAAFGALFVLLSTKFLMEQESETRVQGEKISKIFEEQLREYKNVADYMLKILQDDNITLAEVHSLLDKHATLILIGEQNAIEASKTFIKTCQDAIADETTPEINEQYQIDVSVHNKLSNALMDFLIAARADLSLKNDFNLTSDQELFNEVSNRQKQLEIQVRPEVSLSSWRGLNGKSDSIPTIQNFIKILENEKLQSRITKSQISFRSSTLAGGNIIYLNNFTNQNTFALNFRARPDEDFLEKQAKNIQQFKPRINPYKENFNLYLEIPMDAVSKGGLKDFFQVVDAFTVKYHKKP